MRRRTMVGNCSACLRLPGGRAAQPDQGPTLDLVRGEAWQPGTYVLKTADGRSRQAVVSDLPAPLAIGGPWEVRFAPGGGQAAHHARPVDLVEQAQRCGSEVLPAAVPTSRPSMCRRKCCEKVGGCILTWARSVMAQVKLNGKDLGILWKPPYRVDVTAALKTGATHWRCKRPESRIAAIHPYHRPVPPVPPRRAPGPLRQQRCAPLEPGPRPRQPARGSRAGGQVDLARDHVRARHR